MPIYAEPLQWRHNGRYGILNHQPHHCLLNRLFRLRSKKTSKLRVTGLCLGNSPVTGEFPAQRASNSKNVSIWWRHYDLLKNREPNGNLCTTTGKECYSQKYYGTRSWWLTFINTFSMFRPRQNGHRSAAHIFKCIFLYENCFNLIHILLKYVPNGSTITQHWFG